MRFSKLIGSYAFGSSDSIHVSILLRYHTIQPLFLLLYMAVNDQEKCTKRIGMGRAILFLAGVALAAYGMTSGRASEPTAALGYLGWLAGAGAAAGFWTDERGVLTTRRLRIVDAKGQTATKSAPKRTRSALRFTTPAANESAL